MRSAIAKYVLLAALLLTLLAASSKVHAAAPVPQDAAATLRIINESEQIICYVHISPVTSDDWGEDWLQEDGAVITAGTAWAFWLKPGRYDFLARDCQGEDLEWAADSELSENTRWGIGD